MKTRPDSQVFTQRLNSFSSNNTSFDFICSIPALSIYIISFSSLKWFSLSKSIDPNQVETEIYSNLLKKSSFYSCRSSRLKLDFAPSIYEYSISCYFFATNQSTLMNKLCWFKLLMNNYSNLSVSFSTNNLLSTWSPPCKMSLSWLKFWWANLRVPSGHVTVTPDLIRPHTQKGVVALRCLFHTAKKEHFLWNISTKCLRWGKIHISLSLAENSNNYSTVAGGQQSDQLALLEHSFINVNRIIRFRLKIDLKLKLNLVDT